jgi:hypothetical protein
MSQPHRGVRNQGYSSKLAYDKCFIDQDIAQEVGPLQYNLNPTRIKNCNGCLSVFGPRSSHNGYGVSTFVGNTTAPAQDLVDVDSILSNRNVVASKCKDGKVNNIDLTQFQLQNAQTCNDFLDPLATHLTNPPATYRELAINRFYNLPTQPQANIFWNFAVNTSLESKDNYYEKIPRIRSQEDSLPVEIKGPGRQNPCLQPKRSYLNCGN